MPRNVPIDSALSYTVIDVILFLPDYVHFLGGNCVSVAHFFKTFNNTWNPFFPVGVRADTMAEVLPSHEVISSPMAGNTPKLGSYPLSDMSDTPGKP